MVVEIVVAEFVVWYYCLMNFEMIVKMNDVFVELVLVVMNVEVMEFDIDLKQQNHYVVNSELFNEEDLEKKKKI